MKTGHFPSGLCVGLAVSAVTAAAVVAATSAIAAAPAADPAPNGLALPAGYAGWTVIAPSNRTDNHTIRVIVGNNIAARAAREGHTRPWPTGSVLGKLVWKATPHAAWPTAQVPGEFVHAEFMVKDPVAHAATGGWGFARWVGLQQRPYGKDAAFVQECFGCHTPVKDNDWVFTHPARLP
jgi:hypothetical protein